MSKIQGRGYTLIEFLVVIAIIGVMMLLALSRSTTKEMESKIAVTKSRVSLVQSALDSHIRAGCKSGVRVQPTIPGLAASNFLENELLATSQFDGSQFEVSVTWANYWQTIRVRFASAADAQALFGSLGADKVDGTALVWERGYNNHADADVEGAKQFRAMFEDECN